MLGGCCVLGQLDVVDGDAPPGGARGSSADGDGGRIAEAEVTFSFFSSLRPFLPTCQPPPPVHPPPPVNPPSFVPTCHTPHIFTLINGMNLYISLTLTHS